LTVAGAKYASVAQTASLNPTTEQEFIMHIDKKHISAIIAGSILLSASATSLADSTYVGIHGMWTDLKDFDFNVGPGTVESQFDSGAGFGITLGRSFDQFRGELEYTARMNDIKSHSLNGGATLPGSRGEAKSDAFMLNGYYDIDTNSAFVPYVGAGIGMAKVKFDNFGVAAIPNVLNDSESQFAYQFMAGGEYRFADTWGLFAEYRYFATSDVDVTTTAATGSVSNSIAYKTNNVLLGARFRF
jgi:opacity protein-like surface antigen